MEPFEIVEDGDWLAVTVKWNESPNWTDTDLLIAVMAEIGPVRWAGKWQQDAPGRWRAIQRL